MIKKKKDNSGFTLVELIIAMAILAILMTAISSLMGTGVFNYKRTKADVRLQTNSQDTYNRITDSIMQAKSIVIGGYESADDISFARSGIDVSATLDRKFYVLDEQTKNDFLANPSLFGIQLEAGETISDSQVKYFNEFNSAKKLYVTNIGVRRAVPLDASNSSTKRTSGSEIYAKSAITGTETLLNHKEADGTLTDKIGVKDTLIDSFVFSGQKLFYGQQYEFMDNLNDKVILGNSDSEKKHEFSKSISYVTVSGKVITGCVASINSEDATVDFKIYFVDKNATFTTDGKISVRNKNVMNKK